MHDGYDNSPHDPRAQLARRQEPAIAHLPTPPDAQHAKQNPRVRPSGLGGPGQHVHGVLLVRAARHLRRARQCLDHEAHLLDLAGVQHGLARLRARRRRRPVAVAVGQARLQLHDDPVQLHRVVAAVFQLRLQDPAPQRRRRASRPPLAARGGRRGIQHADLGAHNQRRLADELVQLPEGARPAAGLGGLVVAHRHGKHVIPFLLEVKRDDLLQGAAWRQIRDRDRAAIGVRISSGGGGGSGPELEPLRLALPGRLHLGLDAHIANCLFCRVVRGEVVVGAQGTAKRLPDVRGAKRHGQVEDRAEQEGGRVRRGCWRGAGAVGERCGQRRRRRRGCSSGRGLEGRLNRVLRHERGT